MFETLSTTLKLERPLIFFDLETTGIDVEQDRIIEIAWVKIETDGTELTREWRLNPGIPISAEATAVHGITNEEVADCETFKDIATIVSLEFAGCDLCGHNIKRFDVPMLMHEFSRVPLPRPAIGELVDTYTIFRAFFNHSLESAYRFYTGGEELDAHKAMNDVVGCAVVFEEMVLRHDLERDPAVLASKPIDPSWLDMDGKLKWVNGEATLTFGKHAGKSLQCLVKTDRSYLVWVSKKDFGAEVTKIIRAALIGNFPVQDAS